MTELVNKKRTIADLESFFSPCINQNPILNLPRPIFHIIFGEYLSLKNVAWFDNAVLNYRDRMVFISNISNMTVRNFDGCINSKFQVRWLFQRQILLSSLSLTYKFQNNNVTDSTIEIFPLNVFALESLTARDLNEWNDHLLPLLKKCTKLIHLKLDIEGLVSQYKEGSCKQRQNEILLMYKSNEYREYYFDTGISSKKKCLKIYLSV